MLIEAFQPLRVRRKADVVDLQLGLPVEFDEAEGQLLLQRMPGKVKVVGLDSGPQGPTGPFRPTFTLPPPIEREKRAGTCVTTYEKVPEVPEFGSAVAPAFQVGSVVRVHTQSGPPWVGSVWHILPYQPKGGTTKAGWWYGVESGERWSFVHESRLDVGRER